jgi:hypothetical protein
MIVLLVFIIVACFGLVVYESKNKLLEKGYSSIAELLLISASVSFLLYLIFFHFADYVHSFNISIPRLEFSPQARKANDERDGIEGYVLYVLMFVNILLSFIVTRLLLNIKKRATYLSVFIIFTLFSIIYILKIGFIPPMSDADDYKHQNLFIPIVFLIVTGLLFLLQKYVSKKVFLGVIVLLLIPVCFIATEPISMSDYSYILSPALRFLNGVPLSELYLQYDLYLSLLAAIWMKLNLDLNLFQVTGQFSYFLLFIGIFIFSKKFFINKNLPLFILISAVLIRHYAIMIDSSAIYAVTPLRLDLWFVLLLLVYYKGTYHWLVAMTIGLLLVFHKNFGLIYLLSYIQLLLTLFIIECIQIISTKKLSGNSFFHLLKHHLTLSLKNFLIIFGFIVVSIFLFKGFLPESALLYQKIGVGFLPIVPQSFYWYILVLFSITFALLFIYRSKLSVPYFNTGLLIIYFAIGNSIYFFGRSHEHNILNLAGSFIFVAFLLFDLLGNKNEIRPKTAKDEKSKKTNAQSDKIRLFEKVKTSIITVFPLVFIVIAAYYYSDKTGDKLKIQYRNFKKSQYHYPLKAPIDFAALRRITNNSEKVYFLSYGNDFLYYYYGNYKPEGYFSPCATWLLKKDLVGFMQDLIEKDYYIVTPEPHYMIEIFTELKYNKVASEGSCMAISKDSVELLLPQNPATTLPHIGINYDLGKSGIYLKPINLNNNFTIELIVKPYTEQVPDANILVSAQTDSVGSAGFAFQQNGPNTNQFVFGYAGGKSWINPPIFMLRANEWNYIVVAVNKDEITVYNNGVEVASQKTDFPIKNVFTPVVINNSLGRQNHFNGLIREVKITNDTISVQNIISNTEIIKAKLR